MGNYFSCYYDESCSTKCDQKQRICDLKDAVLCIGCMRFLSIFGYLGIIVLLNCYSDGYWPLVLKKMLAIITIPELILVAFLFYATIWVFATYYVGLYILVRWYSVGPWSTVLTVFTMIAIPVTVICGIILFHGALNEKVWALEVAIWICLAIAAYNTVLGVMGLLFFIREGKQTIHFIIALFFGLLGISLFAIVCHDIVIIYTLKKTISFSPTIPDVMYECC